LHSVQIRLSLQFALFSCSTLAQLPLFRELLILGERTPPEILDTRITEQIAMQAVMQAETKLGNHPTDVSKLYMGYDIESFDPKTGRLRFIEVKGRKAGAETVTVTRNEILTGINSPEQFILAIVEVEDGIGTEPIYIRNPFNKEPDFGVTSVQYDLGELFNKAKVSHDHGSP